MIEYIDPWKVQVTGSDPRNRDVLAQVTLLKNQGQIEPLVLDPRFPDEYVISNHDYPFAVAQVMAARHLEWETIIVVRENKST
jgi:hypothetical protein